MILESATVPEWLILAELEGYGFWAPAPLPGRATLVRKQTTQRTIGTATSNAAPIQRKRRTACPPRSGVGTFALRGQGHAGATTSHRSVPPTGARTHRVDAASAYSGSDWRNHWGIPAHARKERKNLVLQPLSSLACVTMRPDVEVSDMSGVLQGTWLSTSVNI